MYQPRYPGSAVLRRKLWFSNLGIFNLGIFNLGIPRCCVAANHQVQKGLWITLMYSYAFLVMFYTNIRDQTNGCGCFCWSVGCALDLATSPHASIAREIACWTKFALLAPQLTSSSRHWGADNGLDTSAAVTLLLWAVELLRACLFACAPSQGNGVSSTSTTSHDHCPHAGALLDAAHVELSSAKLLLLLCHQGIVVGVNSWLCTLLRANYSACQHNCRGPD